MGRFYWDDILDCMMTGSRSIVPVVGNELLTVKDTDGQPISFSDLLARRCARWLRKHCDLKVPDDMPLIKQMKLARREEKDFSPALPAAHRELMNELRLAGADALPEPLRLLAEIDTFPFFLSTTADDVFALALGLNEPGQILSTQLDKLVDLPSGWQPTEPPRLFQLFGRFGAGGEPAITEEDTLEYMAHLHDVPGRPVRLLSHLRQSHLLLLGNQHPDWLARVFLRFLRDERFTGSRRPVFEALADTEARGPLVRFLSAYSPKTRIFDEDSTAGFIRTLHAKWSEAKSKKPPNPGLVASARSEAEPLSADEGSIFVSYASENRPAAVKFADALAARKLPVWLDRQELRGGDNYAHIIETKIRRCQLFIPIFSEVTAARDEGWFRHEWLQARNRLENIGPERTYVIPVVIDDTNVYGGADLRTYFVHAGYQPHVLKCPGGVPTTEQLETFVQKYRAAKSRKPTAASVGSAA